MSAVVVDASAVVEYLLRTPKSLVVGPRIEASGTRLHVPEQCDLEVATALRRFLGARSLTPARASDVLADYLDLPLIRHRHAPLLARALALRDNFSVYDAAYVALAEDLGVSIVTADARLARAIRAHTVVDVLAV